MAALASDLSDAPTSGRTAKTSIVTILSDLTDLSDRKWKGGGENDIRLSTLAARWRLAEPSPIDHDVTEAAAMAEHYAAPPGPEMPEHDPLRDGLLRGFHEHRARLRH